MSEKINKSFLTIEAKDDINEMLGRNEGSGSSSFTTQLETSEGLTIGKGTDNEESLTAEELNNIKENKPLTSWRYSTNVSLNNLTINAHSNVILIANILSGAKTKHTELYNKYNGKYGVALCVKCLNSSETIFNNASLTFNASFSNTSFIETTNEPNENTRCYIKVTNNSDTAITFTSENSLLCRVDAIPVEINFN